MTGLKTLLLVSLLAAPEAMVVVGSYRGHFLLGAPYNINRKDRRLQQAVFRATSYFNNQSNDAFLFKLSAILTAQRQIVKGLRYIVDLEMSRTVCRKRDHHNNSLSKCDFQPEGPLHQTLRCHAEVWVIPWQNVTKTQVFKCKP